MPISKYQFSKSGIFISDIDVPRRQKEAFKMPKMAIKFYEMDPLSPTYFSNELIIFSINLFQPKFCTERFPLDLNHNFTQMLHFSRDTLLTVCPFESDSFTT